MNNTTLQKYLQRCKYLWFISLLITCRRFCFLRLLIFTLKLDYLIESMQLTAFLSSFAVSCQRLTVCNETGMFHLLWIPFRNLQTAVKSLSSEHWLRWNMVGFHLLCVTVWLLIVKEDNLITWGGRPVTILLSDLVNYKHHTQSVLSPLQ